MATFELMTVSHRLFSAGHYHLSATFRILNQHCRYTSLEFCSRNLLFRDQKCKIRLYTVFQMKLQRNCYSCDHFMTKIQTSLIKTDSSRSLSFYFVLYPLDKVASSVSIHIRNCFCSFFNLYAKEIFTHLESNFRPEAMLETTDHFVVWMHLIKST